MKRSAKRDALMWAWCAALENRGRYAGPKREAMRAVLYCWFYSGSAKKARQVYLERIHGELI